MRRRGPVWALVVVLLVSLGVPAAAVEPGWEAVPLSSGDDVRPHFYLVGEPGAVLKDSLSVINRADEPLRVGLRGADAYNARDGSFAVRRATKGTGAWLAFAEERVTVPARTRADVPFTVTVPEEAGPGDHPGVIVATAGGRDVGVRVHLRVTGPVLAAVGIEKVEVVGDRLRYVLVNRGTTVLTPRLAVRAEGLYGDVVRHGARPLRVELLPGQRVELREEWPGTAALDSVDIRLTVTAPGGARDTAAVQYEAFPWGVAWLTLATVVAVGGGAWHLRRGLRGDNS